MGQIRQVTLRCGLQPGDLGWVIGQHGTRYWEEFRWDASFEALVAGIAAAFAAEHDDARERCWIAELDGARVGCVFLVRASERVAKLRLLLVAPEARGLGVGSLLIDECVRFARAAGYQTLTLWTNDVLLAARKLYARAGFRLVHSEPLRNFGHDLVSETWELAL
jgi:GNAT superfamily N-acetyltransferase